MSAIKNENKMQVFVRVSCGAKVLFVKINDIEHITIPIFLDTGNFCSIFSTFQQNVFILFNFKYFHFKYFECFHLYSEKKIQDGFSNIET